MAGGGGLLAAAARPAAALGRTTCAAAAVPAAAGGGGARVEAGAGGELEEVVVVGAGGLLAAAARPAAALGGTTRSRSVKEASGEEGAAGRFGGVCGAGRPLLFAFFGGFFANALRLPQTSTTSKELPPSPCIPSASSCTRDRRARPAAFRGCLRILQCTTHGRCGRTGA